MGIGIFVDHVGGGRTIPSIRPRICNQPLLSIFLAKQSGKSCPCPRCRNRLIGILQGGVHHLQSTIMGRLQNSFVHVAKNVYRDLEANLNRPAPRLPLLQPRFQWSVSASGSPRRQSPRGWRRCGQDVPQSGPELYTVVPTSPLMRLPRPRLYKREESHC
jgi:hypothetical protein